jgi:nitrate/nitrite transport system substrate-binding protein
VLTGRYTDGLGNIKEVPDRMSFDPFPWHSMAVWILTQMKRWKQIDGDLDYKNVAEQVYLAAECDKVSRELGYPAHGRTYTTHMIMGQVFDPEKPEAYVESFAIRS